jgi:hypothetical protein
VEHLRAVLDSDKIVQLPEFVPPQSTGGDGWTFFEAIISRGGRLQHVGFLEIKPQSAHSTQDRDGHLLARRGALSEIIDWAHTAKRSLPKTARPVKFRGNLCRDSALKSITVEKSPYHK